MKIYKLHNTGGKKEDTPASPDNMPFGKYKGQRIDTLPDNYLIMLADDFKRDRPGVPPGRKFTFKVPLDIIEKARKVLDKRGYRKKGTRWERD